MGPQKSQDLEYLFEFSPDTLQTLQEGLNLESELGGGAGSTERKSVIRSLPVGQPVRGTTVKDKDNQESTKKKKFHIEMKTTNKLEKSRQSARECRARKKLRYQYLDDMIAEREKANDALREELMRYVSWCRELDMGRIPEGFDKFMKNGADVK